MIFQIDDNKKWSQLLHMLKTCAGSNGRIMFLWSSSEGWLLMQNSEYLGCLDCEHQVILCKLDLTFFSSTRFSKLNRASFEVDVSRMIWSLRSMRKTTKKVIFSLTNKSEGRDESYTEYTFNIFAWDEDGMVEMSKRVQLIKTVNQQPYFGYLRELHLESWLSIQPNCLKGVREFKDCVLELKCKDDGIVLQSFQGEQEQLFQINRAACSILDYNRFIDLCGNKNKLLIPPNFLSLVAEASQKLGQILHFQFGDDQSSGRVTLYLRMKNETFETVFAFAVVLELMEEDEEELGQGQNGNNKTTKSQGRLPNMRDFGAGSSLFENSEMKKRLDRQEKLRKAKISRDFWEKKKRDNKEDEKIERKEIAIASSQRVDEQQPINLQQERSKERLQVEDPDIQEIDQKSWGKEQNGNSANLYQKSNRLLTQNGNGSAPLPSQLSQLPSSRQEQQLHSIPLQQKQISKSKEEKTKALRDQQEKSQQEQFQILKDQSISRIQEKSPQEKLRGQSILVSSNNIESDRSQDVRKLRKIDQGWERKTSINAQINDIQSGLSEQNRNIFGELEDNLEGFVKETKQSKKQSKLLQKNQEHMELLKKEQRQIIGQNKNVSQAIKQGFLQSNNLEGDKYSHFKTPKQKVREEDTQAISSSQKVFAVQDSPNGHYNGKQENYFLHKNQNDHLSTTNFLNNNNNNFLNNNKNKSYSPLNDHHHDHNPRQNNFNHQNTILGKNQQSLLVSNSAHSNGSSYSSNNLMNSFQNPLLTNPNPPVDSSSFANPNSLYKNSQRNSDIQIVPQQQEFRKLKNNGSNFEDFLKNNKVTEQFSIFKQKQQSNPSHLNEMVPQIQKSLLQQVPQGKRLSLSFLS